MMRTEFVFAVPDAGVKLDGKPGARRLVPKETPPEYGNPWLRMGNLTDQPALFLEFAELDRSAKAVLGFTNQYGTIGPTPQDTSAHPRPVRNVRGFRSSVEAWRLVSWNPLNEWPVENDKFSSVESWFPEIVKMKDAVAVWRSGRLPAQKASSEHMLFLARGVVSSLYGPEYTSLDLIF